MSLFKNKKLKPKQNIASLKRNIVANWNIFQEYPWMASEIKPLKRSVPGFRVLVPINNWG